MKLFIIVALVLVIVFVGMGSAYALVEHNDDVQILNGQCYYMGDKALSFCRTSSDGTTTGNYLNLRGFSGIVFRTGGTADFGTGDEIVRITNTAKFSIPSGKALAFVDDAVSVSRTNSAGDAAGNLLNLRGFSGIVFRTGGTAAFGTGDEVVRITNTGQFTVPNGKSIGWVDNAVSLARTDTSGTTTGNFLLERGFSGIIFKTGGSGSFGTGNEQVRITSAGNVGIGEIAPSEKLDVAGNIRLTGDIVSPNDICIGTCS